MGHLDQKNTAVAAINALKSVITSVGSPKALLTDQGSNFMSNEFKNFLKKNNIRALRTSAYHPQTNGMVEKLNHTLTIRLRLLRADHPSLKWSSLVSTAVEQYNSTPHDITGFTPDYLFMGRPPHGPLPHDLQPLEEARALATKRTQQEQLRRKSNFDKTHSNVSFEVGQLVIRRIPDNHPELKKLDARNLGPFQIVEKVGPVTYKYARFEGDPKPQLIHVSQLRQWRSEKNSLGNSLFSKGGECEPSRAPNPDCRTRSPHLRLPTPDIPTRTRQLGLPNSDLPPPTCQLGPATFDLPSPTCHLRLAISGPADSNSESPSQGCQLVTIN